MQERAWKNFIKKVSNTFTTKPLQNRNSYLSKQICPLHIWTMIQAFEIRLEENWSLFVAVSFD